MKLEILNEAKKKPIRKDYSSTKNLPMKNSNNRSLLVDPNITVEKAIANKGFYWYAVVVRDYSIGMWNSVTVVDGKVMRERVETFIINPENGKIFCNIKNNHLVLAGGSTESHRTLEQQAEAECNEEAQMAVKNLQYTGEDQISDQVSEWMNELPIQYEGRVSRICIAEYDGPYQGHIDPEDLDNFCVYAEWRDYDEVIKYANPAQKRALKKYYKRYYTEATTYIEEFKVKKFRPNDPSTFSSMAPNGVGAILNKPAPSGVTWQFYLKDKKTRRKIMNVGFNRIESRTANNFESSKYIHINDFVYNLDKWSKDECRILCIFGGNHYRELGSELANINKAVHIDTNHIIGYYQLEQKRAEILNMFKKNCPELIPFLSKNPKDIDPGKKILLGLGVYEGYANLIIETLGKFYTKYKSSGKKIYVFTGNELQEMLDKLEDNWTYDTPAIKTTNDYITGSLAEDLSINLARSVIGESKKEYSPIIDSKYMDKKDHCLNLDLWSIDGMNNILYVTGMSGSGKTTLASDIAKQNNCQRLELDYIHFYYMESSRINGNDKYIYARDNLIKECPDAAYMCTEELAASKYPPSRFKHFVDCLSVVEELLNDFINKVQGNGKLYVVNGASLAHIYQPEFFKDKPIIVKDIEFITLAMRRTYREVIRDIDGVNLERRYKRFVTNFKTLKSKSYKDDVKFMQQYPADIEAYMTESGISLPNIIPCYTPDEIEGLYIFNPEMKRRKDPLTWLAHYKATGDPGDNYGDIISAFNPGRDSDMDTDTMNLCLAYGWDPRLSIRDAVYEMSRVKAYIEENYTVEVVDLTKKVKKDIKPKEDIALIVKDNDKHLMSIQEFINKY